MAQLNRRAMPLQSKVAIVGGGLGGLTLGRVLHVNGIEATIYEQDSSATSRNQGGTLDIHAESGQAALQAAGLLQEFQAIARPEGEAMTITDSTGQTLWHDDGFDGTRPEVDRTKLRDMLLASLPDGMVQWNSKLTGVRSLGNGRHELTFGGGSTVTTDVLVGADGARSKVRALLSDATPIYSGVSFIELSLSNADTRHPSCAEMVGAGSFMALAHGKGLIAQRNADGNIRVYVALQAPPDWPDDFRRAAADAVAAKAQLLQHFDGWAGELRALIADADGALIPRPIYALPVGHCWPRVAGVTLLGDAAHLMSPFAGEGANLAMLDGAELGLAIAKHNSIETALAAYEAGMFARAGEAAAESADNLQMCFQQDAAQRLADLMVSFHDACP